MQFVADILRWLGNRAHGDDQAGAAFVEYCFLVAFIAIVAMFAVSLVGVNLSGMMTGIANAVESV